SGRGVHRSRHIPARRPARAGLSQRRGDYRGMDCSSRRRHLSRYRFRSLALPLVVLLGLLVTSCSSNDDDDPAQATMTPAAATPFTDATASVSTPEDPTPTGTLGPTLPPAAPIQWE